MKGKIAIVFVLMMVSVGLLSGCIGSPYEQSTEQDFKDAGLQTEPVWLTLDSDSHLFDFSDVVLPDGSVENTTYKYFILRIKNTDNIKVIDLSFSLSVFPDELLLHCVSFIVVKPPVGNFLVHNSKKDTAFGWLDIEPGDTLDMYLNMTFRQCSAYTFQDNMTYNIVVDVVQKYVSGFSSQTGESYSSKIDKFQCNVRT